MPTRLSSTAWGFILKKSSKQIVAAGAATLFALAGSTLGGAAPAHAYSSSDPVTSGCYKDAHTVQAWGMYNSKYGEYQGSIALRSSPACGTNWLSITSNVHGNKLYGAIQVMTSGGQSTGTSTYNVGSTYTQMVYAPGHTCVNVYGYIIDIATNQSEGHLPNQTVC